MVQLNFSFHIRGRDVGARIGQQNAEHLRWRPGRARVHFRPGLLAPGTFHSARTDKHAPAVRARFMIQPEILGWHSLN